LSIVRDKNHPPGLEVELRYIVHERVHVVGHTGPYEAVSRRGLQRVLDGLVVGRGRYRIVKRSSMSGAQSADARPHRRVVERLGASSGPSAIAFASDSSALVRLVAYRAVAR
jgi:hypothetical protein